MVTNLSALRRRFTADFEVSLKCLCALLFFCSGSVSGQTIAVTGITGAPVCAGNTVTVTFRTTSGSGTPSRYSNTTVFTAYLSNSTGAAPYVSLTTFTQPGVAFTAGNGGITNGITQVVAIPVSAVGTGYKISIGSSGPMFDGSAGAGASAAFTVNAAAVAGTVSANQLICTGSQPSNVTLSGNTGTIQWQSSTDNTTFSNIAGQTTSTLSSATIGTLTATRYYRAVVTNGTCSATSAAVTVTVSPASVAGTVSTNQSICSGSQPSNITLSGNTGTVQWQSSTDNTTFNNIAGQTSNTLSGATIGTLTATRYYKAVVTSGACSSATSATITVTVSPISVAGSVLASQSICSGSQPLDITLSGNTGTIQWQSSTDNTTFNNIAGQTSNTLSGATTGTLTATRYYKAVVTSGACASATTPTVTVTVSPVSVAGTVSADQSICSGSQPSNITLSGNTGTIQWQSSTDNTTFNNIAGQTFNTLSGATVGALTATRYYKAVVTSGACSSATSATITVTVSPISVAGSVSASQSICTGSQPSDITLSGNTGTIQWQSSTDNTTFNNIAGQTSNTLSGATIGTLTTTRYYKAVVTSGACASATSATITIIVSPVTVAGTVSADQSICSGSQPSNITLSGNTGTIQWQSSTDNTTFNNIAGQTSNTLSGATIGTLTAARYYKAVVTSGACSSAASATIAVTVSPISVAGSVSASQSICTGSQPSDITLSGNSGTIQWQSSTDNITFSNIAGQTSNTLSGATVGTLTATQYYKAVVTSGACTSATSATVVVTVNPVSVAGTVSVNQAICLGSQPADITLSGTTGTIQWQSSTDNVTFSDISGETSVTCAGTILGNLFGDRYYRAVVTSGICSTATSAVISVTVNPLPVAGTVSADQEICKASVPGDITITGCVGAIQWQSSTDNVTFTNMSGQTLATLTGIAIGPLTATTYFRAVVGSGSCLPATSSMVTVTVKSTTWDGTSWSNGAPTATTGALITGNYTSSANGSITACSLTVTNNAVVAISSGDSVSLNGDLNVSSGSFTLENNANLLQSENGANTGNIIVKRNSSALKRQDYTLWSSPVSGQNLLAFSPLTVNTRFYTYNGDTNLYNQTVPSANSFADAAGYLIRMPNNHPTWALVWHGQFNGVPHNGDYTFTMYNGGAGKRFNLVGNPYPSPIDLNAFTSDNASNITGTLYFWRKTNSAANPSYCTWTAGGGFVTNGEAQVTDPNDIVQVGQGFFVEALGGATSVGFNNTQRTNDHANQFFRTNAEKNRIWLNATNDAGAYSQTLVGYIEGATLDADQNIDGRYINDGVISLCSAIAGTDYAIQGRPLPFDASDIVSLNFKATTAGNYSIAIDHMDGFFTGSQDIFLRDNLNGMIHDLKAGAYAFASDAGTFATRFEILYQLPLGVATPQLESQVVVYKDHSGFFVNSGAAIMDTIQVYDVRGRLLLTQKDINASETTFRTAAGNEVLIVKITSGNASVTKKVVN
jgi:hypothetical protein